MEHDVSIVLCGEAGQGLKTVESVLTKILKQDGYNVFATKEYMSRVRGGVNTTSIRVGSGPVSAFAGKIDILIPLNKGRTKHLESRISAETIILGEKENIDETCREGECKIEEIAFTAVAEEVGNKIYSNIVAVGAVCGLFKADQAIMGEYIKNRFSNKDEKIINENIEAAKRGYQKGKDLLASGKVKIEINKDKNVGSQLILNGAEAVGLGAIAGGCNFISAYPMSPSTGVFVFLSQYARKFGIVAEQTEDEICAMNMAQGAWYAGARALVSTSGGGFALMVEGLSLAGMLEMPVVVHIAQRPGPATGLPTRTEQGDLNFVLKAGHGEFPRVIFAPGNIEEAFYLTQKAFNLADKYQVPVFVMTDQYLMDSYYNLPQLKTEDLKAEHHFVKTGKDYQRYVLTQDGVSPRGIPGYGEGLVCADSDEHDPEGHITEDLEQRDSIVSKRLKKLEGLSAEALEPELIGGKGYKILIIGWGTTREMIKEALKRIGRDDISFLHFSQVYPLNPNTLQYLEKAQKVIIIENNALSQFAELIKLQTGFEIKERINKFNGLAFSIEEVVQSLEEEIGEK
jgi:2-oxoglutarate ferredoxin oxidoreductase subunit alpha